jgi:glycerol-3-phosphate dehydrogenase
MSTGPRQDFEVAVIGAGVVGCAVALALARRGVSVALLEAEAEPALGASGTNSGVLHTGFDSTPGELETRLILRSGELRPAVVAALGVPVVRCGALLRPRDTAEREVVGGLASGAARNGVPVYPAADGGLSIPGESIVDPVAFTLALAGAAGGFGAALLAGWRLVGIEAAADGLRLASAAGDRLRCAVAVNCAGLGADEVARFVGDQSFEIYPRKGEFLVFEQPAGARVEQILLPVPSAGTKGVLVFPTVDGMVVAGPTAADLAPEQKGDWSVRAEAREEIVAKAAALHPPLADAEPVFAYAGLRPAGRGVNYVIGPSRACVRLVNVAAIRSTGLTASLGIAERVVEIVASLGVSLGAEQALLRGRVEARGGPWWRRTADYRARVTA